MLLPSFLFTLLSMGSWPQWGGPDRDFKALQTEITSQWSDSGPKILWKKELGPGYAGIVGRDQRAYTGYKSGDQDVIIAFDVATGKTIWEYQYATPSYHEKNQLQFGKGPNSTPLLLEDTLIVVSFTGLLHALDVNSGKKRWSCDLMKVYGAKQQRFGYSVSPLYHNGKLYVQTGGKQTAIVAFDPKSGKELWKSMPFDLSYASPKVINVDGQDQILLYGATKLVGIDLQAGKILWEQEVANQYENNATDPLIGPGQKVWAASQLQAGTRVLQLSKGQGKTNTKELWFNGKVKYHHSNAILIGNQVYAAIGGQVTFLAGIDFQTGEILWKKRGYSGSNLVATKNHLISLDLDGNLALLKRESDGVTEVGSVKLLEKPCRTPPSLMDTTLIIRDQKHLIALDLTPNP